MKKRSLGSICIIVLILLPGFLLPALANAQDDGMKLTRVRSYSGFKNHPLRLGSTGTPLLRISYSDYPDGIGEVLRKGANPRSVSNRVVDQGGKSILSATGLSDATWAWGQFIDHDLDLSDSSPVNGSANINVTNPADILFPTIFFDRANHLIIDGVREQENEVTSFLDASQVYGSDLRRAHALRTFTGGRMKMSSEGLLPLNVDGLPNLGDDPSLFLAGDIRVNENVVLTSMHTLFVREHNRLAGLIECHEPDATDEQIYQMARKIVGAEIQIVTYREFLPALLGPFAPGPDDRVYDESVNPSIANEFSGALFRVGHTLLSSSLLIGDTGETILLQDAFTNPDFIKQLPKNIDHLLFGLSQQRCQEIDSMIIDDVRNFLFLPPPFAIGLDLAALNIQRGRDHGLPPYNDIRQAYGLERYKDFSQISADVDVQEALRKAYREDIDAIDPWVGGICEDHLPGSNVGELITTAIRDQFSRSRDGDWFFYNADQDLNQVIVQQIINLDTVTLGRIVGWNTGVDAPDDMFFVK